jgi:hypothetical protein
MTFVSANELSFDDLDPRTPEAKNIELLCTM